MDTKSKNFSYNRITKIVMFLIATALIISCGVMEINSYQKYGTLTKYYYYNPTGLLSAYDKNFNTDYNDCFNNTQREFESELDSFEQIAKIIDDNKQHSVHELLGINIQQYINKGVRYVLIDENDGTIIGTDGITNYKPLETSHYGQQNKITTNNYIDIRADNNLSKDILEKVEPMATIENGDGSKSYKYVNDGDVVSDYHKTYRVYLFYDDEVAKPILEYRDTINSNLQLVYIKMLICISVFLLICMYFMFVAGKTSKDSETKYNTFDKVPFDVLTFLYGCAGFVFLIIHDRLNESIIFGKLPISMQSYSIIFTIVAIIASSITIFYFSNFGKRIRNKELFSSCLVVVIYKKIYNKIIRPIYDLIAVDSSVSIAIVMVVMLVTGVIYAYFCERGDIDMMVMCTLVIVAIMILLLVNSLRINKAVKSIKNGESYKAEKSIFNYPYASIFADLEDISENVSEEVQKNMTSQRTQVTLVTNVSHDLRTPLTSIIGYVDLLSKKADMYDEETQEYINVLKEKSERMGTMVEDLFDISKSASGDVILNKENLNVKKLVEQTLGELDDVIEYEDKIELNLVNDVCIFADGNKMYRVFQNTVENALKYSLDGTRIYITSEVIDGNKVRIEIKNIANYRMNFTGEEIVQRFKRGDESRTTKGSGLGLSIAQIFTNINGGEFDVVVDGDLFKVVIVFNINM